MGKDGRNFEVHSIAPEVRESSLPHHFYSIHIHPVNPVIRG